MQKMICCFTGHRYFKNDEISFVKLRLQECIEEVLSFGVKEFIAGGAIGFDEIASTAIAQLKGKNASIRLVLALPFPEHDAKWTEAQRKTLADLLIQADAVQYISSCVTSNNFQECYFKRNRYMVDRAQFVIAACNKRHSGSGYTLNYAMEQGKTVFNILHEV